jgi:hypothetical protein
MTNEQIRNGLKALMAVADAIKAAGEIPAGHLYAALMPHGCTLAAFESMVGVLTRKVDGAEPLVLRRGDLLVWNCQQ